MHVSFAIWCLLHNKSDYVLHFFPAVLWRWYFFKRDTETPFLALPTLSILPYTNIRGKRDDFGFKISCLCLGCDFSLLSCGIYISQFVNYDQASPYLLDQGFIYTNGQKKGYTEYMSTYSWVNLKHLIFLI